MSTIDPINAMFQVSEQEYLSVAKDLNDAMAGGTEPSFAGARRSGLRPVPVALPGRCSGPASSAECLLRAS
jgi:hypothetical protein